MEVELEVELEVEPEVVVVITRMQAVMHGRNEENAKRVTHDGCKITAVKHVETSEAAAEAADVKTETVSVEVGHHRDIAVVVMEGG